MTQAPVIRSVLPEELPRLASIHVQAWNMDPADFTPDAAELDDSRVLVVDGDLAAALFLLRRRAWMGPDQVPQVGLGGVATPPEHRRRGCCRLLLQGVLEEARARGDALSLLWPFSHAFYRKLGWEVGGGGLQVTLPLAALPRDAAEGWSPCPVDPDSAADVAALESVYSGWAPGYNGCLVRRPQDWKRRLVRKRERRFGYLLRSPQGDAEAYVIYAFEDLEKYERKLAIREFVALGGEAHAALLAFLRDHDSQARKAELHLPRDSLLLHLWPDRTEAIWRDAFMLRVVDVKQALEALTYPLDIAGEVRWRVSDPLCPWNDGVFRVTWSGGRCAVERADASSREELVCDMATLSGIYAGHLPARAAHALRRLAVSGQAAALLTWLEKAFARRPGFLLDFF